MYVTWKKYFVWGDVRWNKSFVFSVSIVVTISTHVCYHVMLQSLCNECGTHLRHAYIYLMHSQLPQFIFQLQPFMRSQWWMHGVLGGYHVTTLYNTYFLLWNGSSYECANTLLNVTSPPPCWSMQPYYGGAHTMYWGRGGCWSGDTCKYFYLPLLRHLDGPWVSSAV